MTLHTGTIYQDGDISLRPPVPELIQSAMGGIDIQDAINWWWSQALEDKAVYYFSVFRGQELVGHIFLHNINEQTGEALIGYEIFQAADRGKGIGTKMLALLKQYITRETTLNKLFIITSRDNHASQRIAEKCGFTYIGGSREDPINDMVFQWPIVAQAP